MSPTGVSLRRRLPSPKNDTSFFPSESLHDGEDVKLQVPSCASVSTSTCTSPSVIEKLKDEVSYNEADEDESSCIDDSDCSESKSSAESAEEDDESVLGESLIGRKVLVFPMEDDDSVLDSLGDDQSLKEEDEKPMSEDDDELSSSSSEVEDDSTHDPEDLSDAEKLVSRIPRSFIVGKKYYGTKQPRSFDSDEMSHDCSLSVDSNSMLSSSSKEGARGLGLAFSLADDDSVLDSLCDDQSLKEESDGSRDKEQTEIETSVAEDEDDDVSSFFESDDENTLSEQYGANNDNVFQSFQPERNESNGNVFVSMEDELKQIDNNNDNIDDDNIDFVRSCEHDDSSRERKDSISIEDLEEIINESSSSDSEIDFSDNEDETDKSLEMLTKDAKIESEHSKIKRQLSNGLLSSLNCLTEDSFTSIKRLRSSSESSSSIENEENTSPHHLYISDSNLPPLPWLSLCPSHNQSSSIHSLSPKGEIYDKECQEGENHLEFDLSDEFDYSNKPKALNEYSAVDTVPLLDKGICEWPSNLVVDNALTEVDLFVRSLSPQSMQDEEDRARNSVNIGSLDAIHSITPRLQGISVTWCGTVR